MNQFDLRGKYWLLPDGSVKDVSSDEHARIARGFMLGLSDEEMHAQIKMNDIFRPLTKAEVKHHRERGIKKDILDFLAADQSVQVINKKVIIGGKKATVDPRLYVIEKCGWIRTRENCFYAWLWNEATTCQALCCEEFWKKQNTNYDSWLDFVEVKTGREFGMKLLEANMIYSTMITPEPVKC